MQLLAELGFEAIPSKPTIWEIWSIVRHQFRLKGIVVLWFDEAHDLFQSGSHSDIDEMLKMIKSLMKKDTGVIVIMSGTERLSEITSFDAQVSRRLHKDRPERPCPGRGQQGHRKVDRQVCQGRRAET